MTVKIAWVTVRQFGDYRGWTSVGLIIAVVSIIVVSTVVLALFKAGIFFLTQVLQ